MRWVSRDGNVTSPFSSFWVCAVMDVPTMSACNKPSDAPKWASDYGPELSGCYYEGFVDDFNLLLSQHSVREPVTTYGVRKSRNNVSVEDKENESKASYPLMLFPHTRKNCTLIGRMLQTARNAKVIASYWLPYQYS